MAGRFDALFRLRKNRDGEAAEPTMSTFTRLSGATRPIPRNAPTCARLAMATVRSRREHGIAAGAAAAAGGMSRGAEGGGGQHIIILGGGIAGLATARYLLQHAQRSDIGGILITLIDKNVDTTISKTGNSPASTYEEQITRRRPHMNIPSRRNGNYLCPSLTVPWTARPLWKDVILPGLKSALDGGPRPAISFDWKSMIADKNMVRSPLPTWSSRRRF